MRVKAQVAMVMNLDKCIGCHTCSVTCKQVWTNRPGTEYVWFNNVETSPGQGYPRQWADQARWNGGWELDRKGRLRLKAGGRVKKLLTIFSNPDLPGDRRLLRAVHLRLRDARRRAARRPRPGRAPALPAHRQADGRQVGAQLGRGARRRPGARARGPAPAGHAGAGAPDLRAGVHVLPAADLRALPEPVVRRLVPVGRDVQARGGRHRARRPGPLPRLALLRLGLPVQEGLLQPPHRQGREVHALLPADRDRPADDLLGDLRRAHPLPRPRALRRRPRRRRRPRCPTSATCSPPSATCSWTPRTPRCARRRARDGIPRDWIDAARRSPIYDLAMRWGVALPLHPEFRTLPMVWYVPPLSPVVSTLETDGYEADPDDVFGAIDNLRIPLEYIANLLTAGDVDVVRGVLHRLAAMRSYMRKREVLGEIDEQLPGRVGLTGPELERMYRLLAIADYEDRYVIPQAHAELGERLMQEQGGCGLDFDGGPGQLRRRGPAAGHVLAGRALRRRELPPDRHPQAQRAPRRMRRRRTDPPPPAPWALLSFLLRYPDADVAAARDELAGEVAALPDGPVRDGARALPRRLDGRSDGAGGALRRDVRPAPPREPVPHLLRARRHARARHGAAAPEEALPRRRAADGLGRAARPPDGDARVRRARAGRARRGAAGRAPPGDRAAAALAARPRRARTRTCSTRSRPACRRSA